VRVKGFLYWKRERKNDEDGEGDWMVTLKHVPLLPSLSIASFSTLSSSFF